MISDFIDLFGSYSPIQNVVSDIDGVVTYSYSIDWGYIFGAVCFCIALYSVFRIIGCLFRGCRS